MNNDLISRSALIGELEKYHLFYFKFNELETIINNAPSVETLKNITELHCDITKEQLLNSLRPQGMWIAREDMDHLDENKVVHNHFQCNKCGLIHDFIDGHTSQYNFCPNCGADMRGNTNG